MYREAARQSLVILCAAAFLGFSYTFLTAKGFFAQQRETHHPASAASGPSPVGLDEARTLFEKNNAIFVDARHSFDFRRGHIKDSRNIPLADFDQSEQSIASLPKDTVIIVYCDGSECNSSIELAAKLYERGFGGVRIFFGGWQEWTANKLPTETGQ